MSGPFRLDMRLPAMIVPARARDPEFSQQLGAFFSLVEESTSHFHPGTWLWELVYPQAEIVFKARSFGEMPVAVAEGEEPPPPPPEVRMRIPITNPAGKYVVKLCVFGQWRRVVVDDLVPCGHIEGFVGGSYSLLAQAFTNALLAKTAAGASPQKGKKGSKSAQTKGGAGGKDMDRFASLWPQIIGKAILKVGIWGFGGGGWIFRPRRSRSYSEW